MKRLLLVVSLLLLSAQSWAQQGTTGLNGLEFVFRLPPVLDRLFPPNGACRRMRGSLGAGWTGVCVEGLIRESFGHTFGFDSHDQSTFPRRIEIAFGQGLAAAGW